jgi:hypothetical protein
VALRSVPTPVQQRFLVGAVANVALHLARAGRGFAGPVVCDANDLAQAAAGAGIHGGTSVGEDRFGACPAALAEDFGHCGHQHPAPHSDVFPLPPWHMPGTGNLAQKELRIPGANVRKPWARAPLEAKTGVGTVVDSHRPSRSPPAGCARKELEVGNGTTDWQTEGTTMERLSVRLTDRMFLQLDALAQERGVDRTRVVRQLLEAGLRDRPAPPSETPSEEELLDLLAEKARMGNVAAYQGAVGA